MKYLVTEKQDLNSYREGKLIEASSVTEAKRKASRMQVFYGTILTICDDEGLICYKKDKVWRDA